MGDVEAVIVNFRTPELALRCARLVAPDAPVVVVDNASGDGSAARLRDAGLRVVERARNDGFAAGVNAGFAATAAPFVLVLNPDTEPRPGAVARLAEHLRAHPRCGVAAPTLLAADGTPQATTYRRFPGLAILFLELCVPAGYALEHLPARLDPYRGRPVEHAYGAALAIRRAAYADAGPLDERFFLYLEETEWQQRVRARGWTVDHVAGAEVVHLVRGGGEAAEAPSPHFVASARRYLAQRGHRPRAVRIVLGTALTSSWLFLRLIGRADRARAYRRLLRAL